MNFQDLTRIEEPSFYLDVAFRKAKQRGDAIKHSFRGKTPLEKAKKMSFEKINTISKSLFTQMNHIIHSYPNIDGLPEFYVELIKSQIEYPKLKKSLGSANWVASKVDEFSKLYKKKIIADSNPEVVDRHLKEYYGRISSLLKRVKPEFKYLEESRKIMKSFPSIKTSLFTVAVFGFPNVGKTTLLSNLTESRPQISDYAFTTKTINSGFLKTNKGKVQILDTPGTLDRVDKMNDVEKQAYLALKYCADAIIFVFDPGFDNEKQKKLLERTIKKYAGRKEIIIYQSKSDIHKGLYLPDAITEITEVKKKIESLMKHEKMKF